MPDLSVRRLLPPVLLGSLALFTLGSVVAARVFGVVTGPLSLIAWVFMTVAIVAAVVNAGTERGA